MHLWPSCNERTRNALSNEYEYELEGKCFCPCLSVCLSVCRSVSKITQIRVHGFG